MRGNSTPRSWGGDVDELVELHWPFAVRYFHKYHRNNHPIMRRELLWDTTVDTLLHAARHWNGEGHFEPYFVCCVRRGWARVQRQLRWKSPAASPLRLEDWAANRQTLVRAENHAAIDIPDFMSRHEPSLTPRQRQVLYLQLDGLTFGEIAREIGVNNKETPRNEHQEAIKTLRKAADSS